MEGPSGFARTGGAAEEDKPPSVRRPDRIFLLDDDEGVRGALRRVLSARGYEVLEADCAAEGEALAARESPDLALLDLRLPDADGVELIPRLRAACPWLGIIVLTGHGSIGSAVAAMKCGADNFLTKPVDTEALFVVLERVLEERRSRQQQVAGRTRPSGIQPLLGTSPGMRRLAHEAEQIGETDLPVLLVGETGTGKGILARWLHDSGPRAHRPFVDLNCAGISRDLLDAELFGYEPGAFTGAVKAKPGLLEVAHGGSVFLDEIGDMEPAIQARLLKVLEEKRFRRLGDVRDRAVDVRLLAATHQDLPKLIEAGRFRDDLYYRISAVEVHIPPLRERLEDLAGLASSMLARLSAEVGRPAPVLSAAALGALASYPWPGNVRELRNVIEAAALRCRRPEIGLEDLRLRAPVRGGDESSSGPLATLAEVEGAHIQRALAATEGHVARAAGLLGVSTSSLYERVRRLRVEGDRRSVDSKSAKS